MLQFDSIHWHYQKLQAGHMTISADKITKPILHRTDSFWTCVKSLTKKIGKVTHYGTLRDRHNNNCRWYSPNFKIWHVMKVHSFSDVDQTAPKVTGYRWVLSDTHNAAMNEQLTPIEIVRSLPLLPKRQHPRSSSWLFGCDRVQSSRSASLSVIQSGKVWKVYALQFFAQCSNNNFSINV